MRWLVVILIAACSQMVRADDYFQQKVDYSISAYLNPDSNTIKGSQLVIYHNNSPDALDTLYFYLYLNAFKPGSLLDIESRRRGRYRIADLPPSEQGGMTIQKITAGGYEVIGYKIDDTILMLPLQKIMRPGDSLAVYFEFETKIPERGYRMGRRGRHYDMAQWFPKAAVYDRYGWHTGKYLSLGEFYSDFGDYNIKITVPENYLLAHGGDLLNETEIFGKSLPVPQEGGLIVDLLKDFAWPVSEDTSSADDGDNQSDFGDEADPETSFAPSPDNISDIKVSRDSLGRTAGVPVKSPEHVAAGGSNFNGLQDFSGIPETRTWVINLNNAHDFAFAADPDFRVDRTLSNGIIIDCYYNHKIASRWSPRAIIAAKGAIEYYSDIIGPYPYKHFSLVGSVISGGMEYPTLVFVGLRSGRDRESTYFESVIAHEVAHNWFYGMIASNQAEQAFIDEGFASFLECLFIEKTYGRYHNKSKLRLRRRDTFIPNGDERNDVYKDYFEAVIDGLDRPADMPANRFASMDTYVRAAYDKPVVALYHLQYIMGEDKFSLFLKELYRRWKFRHPYLIDIELLAAEIAGEDLRYFFSQWFETGWYLDYALGGVHSKLVNKDGLNWYDTKITITNKGMALSPLDLRVGYSTGESDTLHIPVGIWQDGRKSYVHEVLLPLKPKSVEINPDGRVPDIDRLNNRWRWPKFDFQFYFPKSLITESYIEYYPDRYIFAHQPRLWYNEVDGVKPGYLLHGSYMGLIRNLDLGVSIGTLNGKIDYQIDYKNIFSFDMPGLTWEFSSGERDGRGEQSLGISYAQEQPGTTSKLQTSIFLNRSYLFDEDYLVYPAHWDRGQIYSVDAKFGKSRSWRHVEMSWSSGLTAAIPGSDFRYSAADLAMGLKAKLAAHNNLSLDLFGGFAEGEVPAQDRFYLAEVQPAAQYDNKWFASRGTLPGKIRGRGHLFLTDAVSMPGYLYAYPTGLKKLAGRFAFQIPNPALVFELRDDAVTRNLRKIDYEVYIAHGAVWDDPGLARSGDFLTEAGLQISYEVPYWERFFGKEKLYLFLPLYLSDPRAGDDSWHFRWAVSISGLLD